MNAAKMITDTRNREHRTSWRDGMHPDFGFQDLWQLFDERAAVREFDGGMRPDEASERAWFDMKALAGRE